MKPLINFAKKFPVIILKVSKEGSVTFQHKRENKSKENVSIPHRSFYLSTSFMQWYRFSQFNKTVNNFFFPRNIKPQG